MSGTRVDHWPQDGERVCPACGKSMVIDWDNWVVATYPPIHHFVWRCGCGYHSELMEVSAGFPPTWEDRWDALQQRQAQLKTMVEV